MAAQRTEQGHWRMLVLIALPLLAALLVARATLWASPPTTSQPAPLSPPGITLSATQTNGAISPLLYGVGAGASVSTFSLPIPVSLLAVADVIRRAGATALRFGGNRADDYDWQNDLIYPPDPTLNLPEKAGIGGVHAAIDQFLLFCQRAHVEPVIVVNAEIDDPQKAAALVAYTQQRGYRVTYWQIGAQPSLWTHTGIPLGQRRTTDRYMATPDAYAALVSAYALAMRAVATHPLHLIADSWLLNATDQSWVTAVDSVNSQYYPFVPAASPGDGPTDADIASASLTNNGHVGIDSWLSELRRGIAQYPGSDHLSVTVSDWGLDDTAGAPTQTGSYADYAQGLYAARMWASMITAHVQIATLGPVFGSDQQPFDDLGQGRAAAAVLQLLSHGLGSTLLTPQLGADTGGLTTVAALGPPAIAGAAHSGRQRLTVLVINPDPRQAISTTLTLHAPASGQWASTAYLWSIQHDQPNAPASALYGTSGVHVTPFALPARAPHRWMATFPPLSITLYEILSTS